jgi:HAD superfamily hydrolase (TIGR01509 family)
MNGVNMHLATAKGVIFDVDGTLVNSNEGHARAWHRALHEHGIEVPLATVRQAIGMGGDKLLPAIAGVDEESPIGKKVSERHAELFRTQFLPRVEPFPQTRELFEALKRRSIKVAIASSAEKSELDTLLRVARVDDLLEGVSSASDAENSKPDPDIVRAALQRLDLPASEVIMIGDTPFDIEAASRAGLHSIALRSGGRSDRELTGALAIYDDIADLLQHLSKTPLAG